MRSSAWGILLALAPMAAFADERPIRVGIDYVAPAECPARDAFVARVRQTNGRVEAVSDSAPLVVKVRVMKTTEQRYAAELLIDSGGEDTTRRLAADSCEEVMVAAALVVAVLADTSDAARSDAAPSSPAPATRAPVEPRAPTPAPPPSVPWHYGFGIHLAIDAGLGPDLEPQARPFLAVARERVGIRVALQRNIVSASTPDGTAGLRYWLGRADGCYHVLRSATAALAPCAGFELGVVDAVGSNTRRPREEEELLFSPVALVRGRLFTTEGSSLELDAGVRVPLRRYRFYFGEDRTAYETPAVALTLGVGVGFSSP
jgi:hypothetical protein